jgi:STE24 endopeptidase
MRFAAAHCIRLLVLSAAFCAGASYSQPVGFPLALLVGMIFFFLTSPLLNGFIRMLESEADLFGLNASREPDGFAEVSLKLSEYRKLDPGRLEEWIFYDHPSGRVRIYTAMRWKAENLPQ